MILHCWLGRQEGHKMSDTSLKVLFWNEKEKVRGLSNPSLSGK